MARDDEFERLLGASRKVRLNDKTREKKNNR